MRTTIALDDADTMTALRFVTARLGNLKLMRHLTADQVSHIERLGGRSSNLDAVRDLEVLHVNGIDPRLNHSACL